MIQFLAALGGGTTVILIGLTAWLTYRYARAKDDATSARDLYRDQTQVSAEYKSKWQRCEATLDVTRTQVVQERNRADIAEAQRNVAQERVRSLLRRYVTKATNEEIQELTNEAFTTPLSLAPRAPTGGVPPVPRSQDPRDGLLDPFASDLQPPKPT